MRQHYKSLISELKKICNQKLKKCIREGHPNSKVIISYRPTLSGDIVNLQCEDCGTDYWRKATGEEKKQYWFELRCKAINYVMQHNYKKE